MPKRNAPIVPTNTFSVQDVPDYSTPLGAAMANEEMRRLQAQISELAQVKPASVVEARTVVKRVANTPLGSVGIQPVQQQVVNSTSIINTTSTPTPDIETLQSSIETLPKFQEIALNDTMAFEKILQVEESIGNGTLTITRNGSTLGTFGANQGANATIDIPLQTLPIVNDGVLTIRRNGVDVATFSANQSGASVADISVPSPPSPNNGLLSLQVNGSTQATFSADQSGNSLFNVVLPTVNNQPLSLQINGTTQTTFFANDDTPRTFNVNLPTVNNGSLSLRINGVEQTAFTANDNGSKVFDVTLPTIPTIPTVNNGDLSLRVNGVEQTNFTANDSGSKVFNVNLPSVGDGVLSLSINNGTPVTFSANQSGNQTFNVNVPSPYTHPSFAPVALRGSTTRSARVARDAEGHIAALDEVDISFPVRSVNGQTGDVTISTSSYTHPSLTPSLLNADNGNGALYISQSGDVYDRVNIHMEAHAFAGGFVAGTQASINVYNNGRFTNGVVKSGSNSATGSAPSKAWACVGDVPDWRPTIPLVGSDYIRIVPVYSSGVLSQYRIELVV